MLKLLGAVRSAAALVAAGACLLLTSAAFAAPTLQVEGVLLSTGGAPAVDGDHDLTFSLYTAKDAQTAAWAEGPVKVKVLGGRFGHVLGTQKPIDATFFTGAEAWLGVKVGSDPELPRQMMRSVGHAAVADLAKAVACTGCISADQIANGSVPAAKVGFNYAGSATKGGAAIDLACSGCVSVSELVFDADVDIGGNSLKAKNGTFAGDLVAKNVTAASLAGDGSKLTGIKMPAGDCKVGETMIGIAADGTVKCAPGATGNKVLDGALSTEYNEAAVVSALPLAIPDNTGSDAVATATYGKVGLANSISVDIEIANTDLAVVSIKLLPPDDKAKGLTICDPCGKKDEKSFKLTLTEKSTLKDGSLATYIGKAVDGVWTLKVQDTGFCIVQAPGNETLCKPGPKTDGEIAKFTINSKVTSSVSVGTGGSFSVGSLDKAPFACIPAKAGHHYFDAVSRRIAYCDGAAWRQVVGLCGNGTIEAGEACDDGNFDDADGCAATCALVDVKTSCAAIKTANSAAKDGWYTIDQDGQGPRPAWRTYCDMTTDGGGWTRFMHHADWDGRMAIAQHEWDRGIELAASGGIKQWLIKTYLEPTQASHTSAKPHNAWVLVPVSSAQGYGFTFFKHRRLVGVNAHRYNGPAWMASAKLIAGSNCQSFSHNEGRYLWGEHIWSSGGYGVGFMWMSHCHSPSYHMLIVNHDHDYGAPGGRGQTLVGTNQSPGGQHGNYDEDGGGFEYFYK